MWNTTTINGNNSAKSAVAGYCPQDRSNASITTTLLLLLQPFKQICLSLCTPFDPSTATFILASWQPEPLPFVLVWAMVPSVALCWLWIPNPCLNVIIKLGCCVLSHLQVFALKLPFAYTWLYLPRILATLSFTGHESSISRFSSTLKYDPIWTRVEVLVSETWNLDAGGQLSTRSRWCETT